MNWTMTRHITEHETLFFSLAITLARIGTERWLCVRRTQKNMHTLFSQRGGGGHTEILRTYVQIYVGCTKDDVTQSIEKGDLKS